MQDPQENSNVGFGLIMPFINQHADFAYGFECGRLWGMLEHKEDVTNFLINSENKAQAEMMLKRFGYLYTMDMLDTGWIILNATQIEGKFN